MDKESLSNFYKDQLNLLVSNKMTGGNFKELHA